MRLSLLTIGATAMVAGSALGQPVSCPLTPLGSAQLASVYRNHNVRISQSGAVVAFRSGLERDEDGMPTAYHVGYSDGSRDPGADAICDGGDVLEFVDGKLMNRYASGGSVGDLRGPHTQKCKMDYVAIKAAGFPACGPDHLCMRWYGVAVTPRSCGYNRSGDLGCGVPKPRLDANGKPTGFYLTTNTLMRPGASVAKAAQTDYADASTVPFVVLPGGARLPGGGKASPGDYALVITPKSVSYAVVGDSGPPAKLGEGSRALLTALGTSSIAPGGAYTLLLPGTGEVAKAWPYNASAIQADGSRKLAAALGVVGPGATLAVARACASAD